MSETPPEPAGPDPLEVIAELTAALEGVRGDLQSFRDELKSVREESEARDKALAHAGHRRNRMIIALAASFCIDLLITGALAWNTVRVNDAQDAASATVAQLHASNVSACEQANADRTRDIAIWDTFLNEVAPPATRSAAVKAKVAVINAKIRVKDAPRNCQQLYSTGG
jgi:hypothetical protein